jgi:hypothetical protein
MILRRLARTSQPAHSDPPTNPTGFHPLWCPEGGPRLSSIAALLKKQQIWWLGLAVGVVGVVYLANGFFLFF